VLPASCRQGSEGPHSPSDLRAELLRLRLRPESGGEGLSNSIIAAGIGRSDTAVSQYISGKYPGDVASLEVAIREWLRDRRIARQTGVSTIDTEISNLIKKRLETIRAEAQLALIIGPAGIGKSRAESLYQIDHTLAICFRVRPWHSGMVGLADDLSRAAGIERLKRGQKRWEIIVEKTTGSGRLLIVDDAHELGPRGLQCCVDWHEQTGNPVALIGLPILRTKLLKDARRARRVDDVCELKLKNARPLIEHLVDELIPNGGASERAGLIGLSLQVASMPGCFGSVEKQLKTTAKIRAKNPDTTWCAAFRAAHQRLLRTTDLQTEAMQEAA
jgi:predicted transcriptional regulator